MQQDQTQNKKALGVPDLPHEILRDQMQNITYCTSNTPPFYSTTERLVVEKDNTDPNFLRSTMYIAPSSEFTFESCGLPFSILATPFNEKGTIDQIDGIDMCSICRSYFNCFTKTNNSEIICNICEKKNEQIINYPENLKKSSFECLISSKVEGESKQKITTIQNFEDIEYPTTKDLLKPCCIFMFDMCSLPLVKHSIDAITDLINDENFQLLYENVGFFILNGGLTTYTVNSGEVVKYRLFDKLPFISKNYLISSKDTQSIMKILNEIVASKERQPLESHLLLDSIKYISSLSVGCKFILISSSDIYINYELALSNTRNYCINLFYMTTPEKKSAPLNLEKLAFYSSGHSFKYSTNEVSYIRSDIKKTCLVRSVFDVKLTFKVSDNLVKVLFMGSTMSSSLAVSYMNHMDSNTTVMFNLGIDGVSKANKHIQLQVQFTDYDGSRKIRVFNHIFTTGTPAQIFSSLSFDTLFAAMTRLSISEGSDVQKYLADSLVYYRNKCSSNLSSSLFVLPESIKCLPVLLQSLSKKNDLEKTKIINYTVEQNLRYFYPRLFSLSEYAISSRLEETKTLRLSINNINEDEIYILENSQKIFIYIPKKVDRILVNKLIDDSDGIVKIRSSDEEECVILRDIVEKIQMHYNYEMRVIVCIAGDSFTEGDFLSNMVEDSLNNLPDYVDYIFKLHFEIQKK